MKKPSPKKVAVLSYLDKSANSIRPKEIQKLLEARGHTVVLYDTLKLNKKSHGAHTASTADSNARSWRLPCLLLSGIGLFNKLTFYKFCNHFAAIEMRLMADVFEPVLRREQFDVVIAEAEPFGYVFTRDIPGTLILDAGAPAVEEMWFSGGISKRLYRKLLAMRNDIYKSSHYVNYQWYMYTNYIRKHVYDGANIRQIDWGQVPKKLRAKYSSKPRIIMLGNLGGYWNNFPLLSKLSKEYTIDVYGHPAPQKKWGLNYKGYAPSTADGSIPIIANYQFGLITITQDELRKSSFSSKHLEYLSYGLPVLTPDWRKDKKLADVSILYNEVNFLAQVKKYSDRKEWQAIADRSYARSKEWTWDKVLAPLIPLVEQPVADDRRRSRA